jgi:hypothetical protein
LICKRERASARARKRTRRLYDNCCGLFLGNAEKQTRGKHQALQQELYVIRRNVWRRCACRNLLNVLRSLVASACWINSRPSGYGSYRRAATKIIHDIWRAGLPMSLTK